MNCNIDNCEWTWMNIYATYLTTNKPSSFAFNTVKEPASIDIRVYPLHSITAVIESKFISNQVIKFVVILQHSKASCLCKITWKSIILLFVAGFEGEGVQQDIPQKPWHADPRPTEYEQGISFLYYKGTLYCIKWTLEATSATYINFHEPDCQERH